MTSDAENPDSGFRKFLTRLVGKAVVVSSYLGSRNLIARIRAMMPGDNAILSHVMTLAEIADHLKVHRNTIYRIAHEGKIPAFKIGTNWRFDRDAIGKWMTDPQAKR